MPSAVVNEDSNTGPYIDAWMEKIANHRGDGDKCEAQELAAEINDDERITDDERIKRLRPVFAAVNPPRRLVWRPDL
jgi:hypothetical protein